MGTTTRHGIYVCDWAEFGNVDTLISVLKYQGGKLDKGTAASLLETRTAVEGLAARLFISRCTNADILALRSIINDFRAEAQVKPRADVDKLAELACSFHRYICVKSGNNVIPLIVNGFHDVNMALWTLWIRQVGPRAAGDVLDELRAERDRLRAEHGWVMDVYLLRRGGGRETERDERTMT